MHWCLKSIQYSFLCYKHGSVWLFEFAVIREQQGYLERLDSLMTDKNTVELRYLKTFLVGPPGVGKTTTLNRLLKTIDNISSAGGKAKPLSTLLANCFQVFALVSSDGAEWISSNDLNHETALLFRYLCGCKLEEVPLEQTGMTRSSTKSTTRLSHSILKHTPVRKPEPRSMTADTSKEIMQKKCI